MDVNEVLELMRQAVLACQKAGVKIGIRVVEWQDEVDVVMIGVGLVNGRLIDVSSSPFHEIGGENTEPIGKDGQDG